MGIGKRRLTYPRFAADQQRGLCRPSRDRRNGASSVRVEATERRRLPETDGRTVRVRAVHRLPRQIRGSRGRLAGPVGRLQGATVPRELRLLSRQLRQGPQQTGQGPAKDRHHRQLARFLHFPSGQRSTCVSLFFSPFEISKLTDRPFVVVSGSRRIVVRRHERFGAARSDPVLREAEQSGQRVHGAVQLEPPVQQRGGRHAASAAAPTTERTDERHVAEARAPPRHRTQTAPRPSAARRVADVGGDVGRRGGALYIL